MHSEHLAKSCERKRKLLLVKKRKQAVMYKILTPSPIKSAESSTKDSQKSGPKELDAKRASYFYVCSLSGMCVLFQVISASSCERNWSAHRHIQTKIHNKVSPETAEKLVYFDSTSKMAATVRDADELKMFAWYNEDV